MQALSWRVHGECANSQLSVQYLHPSKICAVTHDCSYLGVLSCGAPREAEVEDLGM